MRRCRASALSCVAVLAVQLATAHADPRPMKPDAKQELDHGIASMEKRDYVAAIASFDVGYALDPHPDFLYVKAQAQRMGGDCRAALGTYKAFLATNPPRREADRANANIKKCEEMLATSPIAPPIETTDSKTETPPSKDEFKKQDLTSLRGGSSRDIAPPPQTDTVPWWHDRIGLTLAISGAVALAGGVGFTLLAQKDTSDAANAGDLSEWRAAQDAWDRDHVIAGVGFALGVGLAGAAIIRFATADHSVKSSPVGITSTRDGTVVFLGGRW
jgi:hypothetical protein